MDDSTPCTFLRRFRTELRLLAVVAAAVLPVGGVLAQGASSGKPCEPAPAKAVSVQGTVESKGPADAQWQPVKLNDTFCPGDSIRVQAKSRADITLLDQSVLRLNANSTITVEDAEGPDAPAWSGCCAARPTSSAAARAAWR